jgi:hypothetical protein
MAGLRDELNQRYLRAGELERLARQSPDNIEAAFQAATEFGEVARISSELENETGQTSEESAIEHALTLYYHAQRHKSLSWYWYEKRQTEPGLAEAEQYEHFLSEAIQCAEGCLETAGQSARVFLQRQLDDWKVSLLAGKAHRSSLLARKAWDSDDAVSALDYYRQTVQECQNVIASMGTHRVDPAVERIVRGNSFAMMANAAQAMFTIVSDRFFAGGDRAIIPPDEAMRLLGYLFQAYQFGRLAADHNPEWHQINIASTQCRRNIEQLLDANKDRCLELYCEFENQPEFLTIMRHVDLKAYRMAEEGRMMEQNKAIKLWSIGGFWLFAFVVVGAVIIVLTNLVGFWLALVGVVGIETVFLILIGVILRSIGDLSEKNFLQLLGLAVKFQFSSLLSLTKSVDSASQQGKEMSSPEEKKPE